jgi:hypothetical protein
MYRVDGHDWAASRGDDSSQFRRSVPRTDDDVAEGSGRRDRSAYLDTVAWCHAARITHGSRREPYPYDLKRATRLAPVTYRAVSRVIMKR